MCAPSTLLNDLRRACDLSGDHQRTSYASRTYGGPVRRPPSSPDVQQILLQQSLLDIRRRYAAIPRCRPPFGQAMLAAPMRRDPAGLRASGRPSVSDRAPTTSRRTRPVPPISRRGASVSSQAACPRRSSWRDKKGRTRCRPCQDRNRATRTCRPLHDGRDRKGHGVGVHLLATCARRLDDEVPCG